MVDETFIWEFAEARLMEAEDVALIARVNRLDNFTLHFARVASDGVQDALKEKYGEEWWNAPGVSSWFNAFAKLNHDSDIPAHDLRLRAVCKRVYEKLDGGSEL